MASSKANYKIKLDENAAETRNAGKANILKAFAPTGIKREALGELGNRATTRGNSKESAADTIAAEQFKHIKPRVDCHWKSNAVPQPQTKPVPGKIQIIKNVVVKPPTKLVQRTSSNSSSSGEFVNARPKHTTRAKDVKVTSSRGLLKPAAIVKPLQRQNPVKTKNVNTVDRTKEETHRIPTILISAPLAVAEPESHSYQLLNHVENIDSNDKFKPLLCSEYINDIYNYLYELEISSRIEPKFLENHLEISSKMRATLVDWLNEVHYQFSLVPETYYLAVALTDRYLQETPHLKRKQLQLLGVSALFVASKYEDMFPPNINDFVYITDNSCSARSILAMEKSILCKLDFKMGLPLANQFLRRYSKAASVEGIHHHMSKYFIELTSVEYDMAHLRPSEVSAASLLLSLLLVAMCPKFERRLWNPTIEYYSTYSLRDLKPIAQQIAALVKNAPNAKHKSVYVKYSSSKFEKIALNKTYINETILDELCQDED